MKLEGEQGVGRRITQLIIDLKNKGRYRQLKELDENNKNGENSLPYIHKKGIKVYFFQSRDLLTGKILNNI